MDEEQSKLLRGNHVAIVNDLEPQGKVLDSLYEDGILTENDVELISSATTRKERCQLLLSILPTRGPVAYGSFQKALEVGRYEHLAEKLGNEGNGNENILTDVKVVANEDTRKEANVCSECEHFYSRIKPYIENVDSELAHLLEAHCCLILNNVEPRDVIDQLYQDHAITADGSERIKCGGVTRRQRCEVLIEELIKTKLENAIVNLKLALNKKYKFIVDIIEGKQCSASSTRDPNTSRVQVLQKSRKCWPNSENPDDVEQEIEDNQAQNVHQACVGKENKTCHQLLQKAGKRNMEQNTYARVRGIKALTDKDSLVEVGISMNTTTKEYSERVKSESDEVDGSALGEVTYRRILHEESTGIDTLQLRYDDMPKMDTMRSKVRRQQLKQLTTSSTNNLNIDSQRNPGVSTRTEIVTKQMSSFPSDLPSKRLCVAFNFLSTLINQGDFTKFENVSSCLKQRFPTNHDMMCIIGYLHASRDLFGTDFDSAKKHINEALAIVPKTSNPRYFTLELYTAKTRMYVTQKKLQKLKTALDEAIMILETDPAGCTGRAAGWLYINDARNNTAQLACLNLSKTNALHAYSSLFERAKSSFQRSMTNFKKDGGKDGPFGFAYALCRLVILLLRCGDNGLTMDVLQPPSDDITSAGQLLQHLDNSDINIIKILDMHFRLAKCDYQFRRGNLVRALEHAQVAYDIATDLNMLEFKEHAYNRLTFLRSRAPIADNVSELSEEEVNRILFGDSSDSDV